MNDVRTFPIVSGVFSLDEEGIWLEKVRLSSVWTLCTYYE